jgi:hypothetical protein
MTTLSISPSFTHREVAAEHSSIIHDLKSKGRKTLRAIGRSHSNDTSPIQKAENGKMMTPGMSRGMNHETVMCKHFGVSIEQMKRTQALLRLGVTEEDVKIAERLFSELPLSEELISKEERLLGLTRSEISFFKALEVLGADLRIIEEERSKRLGGLGIHQFSQGSESPLSPTSSAFGCPQLCPRTSSGVAEEGKEARRIREMEYVILEQNRKIALLTQEIEVLTAKLNHLDPRGQHCEGSISAGDVMPFTPPDQEKVPFMFPDYLNSSTETSA